MQFTYLLAIIATLGLAQAQLPNLPSCSLNCFLSALQSDGCPSLTNFTCHCAVPSLVGAITPCVQSACDLSDQSSVSDAVTSVCSSASVPISIPPVTGAGTTTGSAATTTSSGSAAAGSGSGSGSGSTTPSRTSCSGKSSTSASSSSGTGGAGGVGSASSTSGVTSGASASTSTSTSTSTGTGTTTGTTTTGAPQATGAAGSVSVPLVGTGLFAMVIAALFAL